MYTQKYFIARGGRICTWERLIASVRCLCDRHWRGFELCNPAVWHVLLCSHLDASVSLCAFVRVVGQQSVATNVCELCSLSSGFLFRAKCIWSVLTNQLFIIRRSGFFGAETCSSFSRSILQRRARSGRNWRRNYLSSKRWARHFEPFFKQFALLLLDAAILNGWQMTHERNQRVSCRTATRGAHCLHQDAELWCHTCVTIVVAYRGHSLHLRQSFLSVCLHKAINICTTS